MESTKIDAIVLESDAKVTLFELITYEEARKVSVIKHKHLEEHLLNRLREYQINLINAIINPKYYDYDQEYLKNSIKSVMKQLKGKDKEINKISGDE